MFGRKAKRIAELEAQLKDARENLAVAVVPTGLISQRIEVRKGQWYVVSFRCRHNGGQCWTLPTSSWARRREHERLA